MIEGNPLSGFFGMQNFSHLFLNLLMLPPPPPLAINSGKSILIFKEVLSFTCFTPYVTLSSTISLYSSTIKYTFNSRHKVQSRSQLSCLLSLLRILEYLKSQNSWGGFSIRSFHGVSHFVM